MTLLTTALPARYAWFLVALLSVLFSMSGITNIGFAARMAASPTATPAAQQRTAIPATVTNTPVSTPTPAVTPSIAVAPQPCSAPTYNLPLAIDLSDQAVGLTQHIDTPTYYQIYGNTSTQIKAQLYQCTPLTSAGATTSERFAAQTGGSLSWQYNTSSDSVGTCTISNVKVGIHINTILPMWQPTSAASSGLASTWQNLIQSLTVHENGHTAFYQQYAAQLLTNLQSLPAMSCASTTATVADQAAAVIAALGTAHATYDATTNHGVNQGAILH